MRFIPDNITKKIGKHKKPIIIISVAALVAIGIIILLSRRTLAAGSTQQRTATVRRGDISTTITGSGPVASSNRIKITSKVAGTISAVNFKEGDAIKAGDVLVEIDSPDARTNVEKSKNSLSQAQLTLDSSIDDVNSLSLTAPFGGQVTNLNADAGSVKTKNDTILTLVDTSRLKLTLTFGSGSINEIKAGQDASVYIQDVMDTVDGKVTYVSDFPYPTSSGGEVYKVEIEVANPGSLTEGMKANAEISTSNGTVTSMDSASMEYVNKSIMRSAGGTVKGVYVKENQYVKKGSLMVSIDNQETVRAKEANDIKVKDLQTQLDDAQQQLDNCKIAAPIDGIIVSQTINVGDTVKAGDAITTVLDDKSMELVVSVDELDIEKLKVGQKANITIDAISDTTMKPRAGEVSHIALEGTSTNGVTTYPVTVKINECNSLRTGMNANADIFISNKTNVLYVPIEAVQRIGGKSYVMVKGDAKTIDEMKKNGTYIDLFSGDARPSGGAGNTNAGGNSGSSNNRNSGNGGNSGGSNNRNNGSGGSSNRNSQGAGGSSQNPGGNTNQNQGGNNSQVSRAVTNALARYKEYYADAIPTPVEVGLNNETSIEIVSGLKEGDVVILPPISTGSTGTQQSQVRTQTGGFPMGGGAVFRGN